MSEQDRTGEDALRATVLATEEMGLYQAPDWDGFPQNRECNGWHWLRAKSDGGAPFIPDPVCRMWIAGMWIGIAGDTCTPEGAAWRCEYLGPCMLPEDVAAVAALSRRRGMEEAARVCQRRAEEEGEDIKHRRFTMLRDERGEREACADMAEELAAAIRALAQEARDV